MVAPPQRSRAECPKGANIAQISRRVPEFIRTSASSRMMQTKSSATSTKLSTLMKIRHQTQQFSRKQKSLKPVRSSQKSTQAQKSWSLANKRRITSISWFWSQTVPHRHIWKAGCATVAREIQKTRRMRSMITWFSKILKKCCWTKGDPASRIPPKSTIKKRKSVKVGRAFSPTRSSKHIINHSWNINKQWAKKRRQSCQL